MPIETTDLEQYANEIVSSKAFHQVIQAQQILAEAQKVVDNQWSVLRDKMEEYGVKSIKGDFGSITLAERTNLEINQDLLPENLFMTVPDTTKIRKTMALNGDVEGVSTSTTKYLTKRLKASEGGK